MLYVYMFKRDNKDNAEPCEPDGTMRPTVPLLEPKKPKRPHSGFTMFMREKRDNMMDELKKTNPKCTLIDVSKHAGGMWTKMTNEEKEVCIHYVFSFKKA